jgi:hypothetical protein
LLHSGEHHHHHHHKSAAEPAWGRVGSQGWVPLPLPVLTDLSPTGHEWAQVSRAQGCSEQGLMGDQVEGWCLTFLSGAY